ncbi:hypothetical protein SCB49_13035 [unidentified eubacterium SCB49]|nr:hypothetical protein SCB49_13035 [unidentified eubacterium SCB49]
MKNKFLILVLLFVVSTGFSQKKITWDDLAKVTFSDKYFPAYEANYLYPAFSESVKELVGTRVTLTGYFLNIDPQGELLILSKGPMSSCFFCGVGGPETAVELQIAKNPNIYTDTIISITGTFKTNSDDVDHFNYILEDCDNITIH